ncbi:MULTISPECIES: HipA family kinase [Aeromonas]|uniref:HipA family kinase n=1 Tax=Aeromonas TaxID=642 RepID=UPI001117EA7B|nr:HipA family kinase [Aeromonas veronii]TNJ03919.1 hypothetical protein CF117_10010 [Aeromonas veronii]
MQDNHQQQLVVEHRPYQVTHIIRVMQEGSTGARLCECQDGNLYVVKTLDEVTPRQLIAEWVCGHLAKAFGLMTPECRLVYGMPELMRLQGQSSFWDDDTIGFASRYHGNTIAVNMPLARAASAQLKSDILVFDVWVKNGDRTLSDLGGNVNLLFDLLSDPQIVVFDHNLALVAEDDEIHIRQHHVFSGDNRGVPLNDIVTQDEYIERMAHAMSQLPQVLAAIPQHWRELANRQLGGGDIINDVVMPILGRYENHFWRWIEL